MSTLDVSETLGGRREEERVPCRVEGNLDVDREGRIYNVSMADKKTGFGMERLLSATE